MSGYKILDEIEPVRKDAWALHPQMPFWGSMFLPTHWLAILGAANSWMLGHPRRKHHLAVGVAALLAMYAIGFVADQWMPEVSHKYVITLLAGIHLWLGYYLTEEQEWAAEMFEQAGGKVLGLAHTIGVLRVLGALLVRRRR
jgi:hypothetical protein